MTQHKVCKSYISLWWHWQTVPLNGWSLWHRHKGVAPHPACIVLVFWSTGLSRLTQVASSFSPHRNSGRQHYHDTHRVVWWLPTFTVLVVLDKSAKLQLYIFSFLIKKIQVNILGSVKSIEEILERSLSITLSSASSMIG